MAIVFGHRLFGKVDRIKGIGHVATKCYHINYLPLIPVEGYLVLAQSGKRFRGVPIPVSAKSYLIAWVRLVSGLAGFFCTLVGMILTASQKPDAAANAPVLLGIGLATAAICIATYFVPFVTTASYARAVQLAKQARLGPAALEHLAIVYGKRSSGYASPARTAPAPAPEMMEWSADDGEQIPLEGFDEPEPLDELEDFVEPAPVVKPKPPQRQPVAAIPKPMATKPVSQPIQKNTAPTTTKTAAAKPMAKLTPIPAVAKPVAKPATQAPIPAVAKKSSEDPT